MGAGRIAFSAAAACAGLFAAPPVRADNPAVVLADPPSDRTATSGARHPALVASARTGGFLMVWVAGLEGSRGSTSEVFSRLIDRNGRPASEPVRVTQLGAEGRGLGSPAVAADPERDGFVVTFTTSRPTGDRDDGFENSIYAQRLDSAGAPVADGPVRLARAGARGHFRSEPPAIATDPETGHTFVAWAASGPRGMTVQARLLDSEGSAIGGARTLSPRVKEVEPPTLASNPRERTFFVAWSDKSVKRERLVGRIVQARAGASTRPFDVPVARVPIDSYYRRSFRYQQVSEPRLAYDATSDRFALVWTAAANYGDDGEGYSVAAQRLSPDGRRRIGRAVRLSPAGSGDAIYVSPSITHGAADETFTVAWIYAEYQGTACPSGALEFARLPGSFGTPRKGVLDQAAPGEPYYNSSGSRCFPAAGSPAVVARPGAPGFLAVWESHPFVVGATRG